MNADFQLRHATVSRHGSFWVSQTDQKTRDMLRELSRASSVPSRLQHIDVGGAFALNSQRSIQEGLIIDFRDGHFVTTGTDMQAYIPAQSQLGLDIDGEYAGDFSGWSVSMNAAGDRIAIGAIFNAGNGYASGHVRVYELVGNTWTNLGLNDINGEAAGDQSGWSVSMNAAGDRIAIGAPYNDGNGTANSGHVRVYSWDGSAWTKLGLNDIDGEAAVDQSGRSISMNAAGDRVAIGAYFNAGNGPANSGHVRVYELVGNTWTRLGLNEINGEDTGDQSGSVSMNAAGDRVAIGAPYNDGNGPANSGHVRVYELVGNTWTKLGLNDIDGEDAADQSGWSVSMNAAGDRIAIGATLNDGNGSNSGHVRVYELVGNTWTKLGLNDINGEAAGDQSGISVSLNAAGDRVAIGAPSNDGNGIANSGHVRVYELVGNTWTQLSLDIDGEVAGDFSGYSVSMNAAGDRVAIGAYYNDGNGTSDSGHVRVYDIRPPSAYTQPHYVYSNSATGMTSTNPRAHRLSTLSDDEVTALTTDVPTLLRPGVWFLIPKPPEINPITLATIKPGIELVYGIDFFTSKNFIITQLPPAEYFPAGSIVVSVAEVSFESFDAYPSDSPRNKLSRKWTNIYAKRAQSLELFRRAAAEFCGLYVLQDNDVVLNAVQRPDDSVVYAFANAGVITVDYAHTPLITGTAYPAGHVVCDQFEMRTAASHGSSFLTLSGALIDLSGIFGMPVQMEADGQVPCSYYFGDHLMRPHLRLHLDGSAEHLAIIWAMQMTHERAHGTNLAAEIGGVISSVDTFPSDAEERPIIDYAALLTGFYGRRLATLVIDNLPSASKFELSRFLREHAPTGTIVLLSDLDAEPIIPPTEPTSDLTYDENELHYQTSVVTYE